MTDRSSDPGAGPEPAAGGDLPALPTRVAQLFVSPAKLFDGLRERPAWLGALGLLVVIGGIAAFLFPTELMEQAMLDQAPPDATPEQIEQMEQIASTAAWTKYLGVLYWVFAAAVVPGLLITIYNFALGGTASYRQLFASTVHALLIPAIGGLVTLPLILQTGDIQTALGLHLLVPGIATDTFLYRLLQGLNVFGLWCCVVLGVAVSRIYPKRTAGSAAMVLLGAYAVFKALAALAGGFG
ncbi:MAG: YIP1 family protein [Gemmatimonadota bacterium]